MTNDQKPNDQRMTNSRITNNQNRKSQFDLEERTAIFAEQAIEFARNLLREVITVTLIDQFIRSSTSIGANYCEADEAVSKKEFKHRISICAKEAKETKYWIRMIVKAFFAGRDAGEKNWREAKELHLIFAAIK